MKLKHLLATLLISTLLPVSAQATNYVYRIPLLTVVTSASTEPAVTGIALGGAFVTVDGATSAPSHQFQFTGPVPPSHVFTIANVGSASVQITGFTSAVNFPVYNTAADGENPDFDTCTTAPLLPGGTCTIFAYFDPQAEPGPILYSTLSAVVNGQPSVLANMSGIVP